MGRRAGFSAAAWTMLGMWLMLALLGSGTARGQTPRAESPGRQPDKTATDLIHAAFDSYDHDRDDQAADQFRQAITLAKQNHDEADEAEAHRGLGLVLIFRSRYGDAQEELQQALAGFQAVSDELGSARAQQYLGTVARLKGDWATARQLYKQSLVVFESHNSIHDEAILLGDMQHDPSLTIAKKGTLVQQSYALAQKSGDIDLEGKELHDWGDTLFSEGNFAEAIEKLDQARECFKQAGDQNALGRLLTSEGRIYRAHGMPEQAIDFYRRGLAIQLETGDLIGAVQNINSTAIAHNEMGDQDKALAEYESALTLARKTGSPAVIDFALGNLAGHHLQMGHYATAVAMLKDVISTEKNPYLQAIRNLQLSGSEFGLGHYDEALDAADHAAAFRTSMDQETSVDLYFERARAEGQLGRTSDAIADVNASLAALEAIRSHLSPADRMKRRFMDEGIHPDVFDLAIGLYLDQRNDWRAMEIAEAARSRALEDLLASRIAKPSSAESEAIAAAEQLERGSAEPGASAAGRAGLVAAQLRLRGSANPARKGSGLSRPNLASFESAQPLTEAQIATIGARMRTTILSYWVGRNATYIWVVHGGEIHAATSKVSFQRLRQIVHALWPAYATEKEENTPNTEPASPAINGQAGERLEFESDDRRNWRALYTCLIRPVEKYLPHQGDLITVEAHGPLLLVPFAALEDEHGRYLLERYALSATPSLSLLSLESSGRPTPKSPHFVLVADPDGLPQGPDGAFSALPGARTEVRAIAALISAKDRATLIGPRAQEADVEAQLSNADVIHFATHAILDDRHPDQSWLALGRGELNDPEAGRLTAEKIYNLDLHADLVFLSACRTGMGRVSGDGVIGLTRAFFYAGASSVIASLWDVSDQTTQRLVPAFYRAWLKDHDKSEALREAQLQLLRDLRAGRIRVQTIGGTLTLPEDPVLWASFVLEGNPH